MNLYENIKIGILGGDFRQVALARRLSKLGFEVAVWGLGASAELGGAVQCVDYISVINSSAAVVLPLPASSDGVRINFSLHKAAPDIRLSEIIELVSKNKQTLLLGGRFTPTVKNLAAERSVKLFDYFELEEFKIKNALPTAEGALEIAMRELPITIHGSCIAVAGYGRIGEILTKMLRSLGANVTVAARSDADLAWAELLGCKTLKIGSGKRENSLYKLRSGYDVIFNTIPVCLFDSRVLAGMAPDTLLIELASSPGGFDADYAREAGLKLISALSLPGKTAPHTAGAIICDCVLNIPRAEGVI